MKIIVSILFALVSIGYAAEIEKCDTCAVNKEYVKCGHYVEMKGDLSYQNSCLLFAQSIFEGNNYSRASWYYLIGGDFDNAIKAGEKSLEAKEYFVAELIAEAYILKGDQENAKKYFKLLKKRVPPEALFLKKHFEILERIYPDKFESALAIKLLQES
ncbi:MAG: hypothetical protein U9Q90_03240 [Campylobacterota bacterium]|nr:hypothetical protein [Campylobacterota bacterium]